MDDNIVNNLSVGSLLSDHFAIHFNLNVGKPPPLREFVQYRKLKSVNHQQLDEDLQNVGLAHESGDDINQLVTQYNDRLSQLLDKHAPMKKAKLVIKPRALWYTPSIAKAKRLRRKLERQWRRTKLTVHQQMFKEQRQQVSSLNRKTHAIYYNNKVTECAGDQEALFSIVDKLLHRTDIGALPSGDSNAQIASRMSDFFSEKIDNIWNSLPTDHAEVYDIEPLTSPLLSAFRPADQEEICDIIKKSACATCSLDPTPTPFIKQLASVMIPVITYITNESLRSGSVPFDLKEAVIKPLLKKQGLDIPNRSNYRPVSNLPFLSKIMERVVVARLKEHMTEHSLCEGMQSAYKAGHSTETALVRVKNDILTSMDKNQCVLLVLLDLSADFDTVNHSKLLRVSATSHRSRRDSTHVVWFILERTHTGSSHPRFNSAIRWTTTGSAARKRSRTHIVHDLHISPRRHRTPSWPQGALLYRWYAALCFVWHQGQSIPSRSSNGGMCQEHQDVDGRQSYETIRQTTRQKW